MRSDRLTTANSSPAKPETSPRGANVRRRNFLLALGAGGAGAAALAARSLSGVAPAATGATDPDAGEGYRLTDHVKRYYQTAKT
jgi:ferric-dicitrate binding protein FerR (iron transport regulator)